jgi:putative transposase
MPRLPRFDMPGTAQHVVQRGNNRQPCFFTDADRLCYLTELRELTRHAGCAVHAYVLMTNHVHLLLTPSGPGQIPRIMQSLGRRYVRFVNDRYGRTGTLWEGRYKACLVASDEHLLCCHRYIELNPVRAGMMARAADYRWSSHRANAFGIPDPLVEPHPQYVALGVTPRDRQEAYREFVAQAVPAQEIESIRSTLQRQHVLGSQGFRHDIESRLDRRAGPARIGRPRRMAAGRESAL